RYPCWGASKAYTALWEYKQAVERAGSFEASAVIRSLEGHKFSILKDEEQWRKFDHQNIQTIFLVKCKEKKAVLKDPYKLDFFDIIDYLPGGRSARTYEEWKTDRLKANLPTYLEKLPGE
ncbi:branched-chain amino acid ABC transporter substrate-binding protein, partial [Candidatus Magnetomorum sp. HK-1]